MKFTLPFTSVAFVLAIAFASAQGKTTMDGVYSEGQARRGEAVYAKACAGCHQPDLSGDGQAPALAILGIDGRDHLGHGGVKLRGSQRPGQDTQDRELHPFVKLPQAAGQDGPGLGEIRALSQQLS